MVKRHIGLSGLTKITLKDTTKPIGRATSIADGKEDWTKGDAAWSAYRIDEVTETLEDLGVNEAVAVLELEGEPNVELARSHGIVGLTFQGSNWTEAQVVAVVEALRATGKNVTLVVLRDNDVPGIKKAELIKSVCSRLQFPCIVIDPVAIYPDIPDKGDIKEILDNMDADEFIRRLEEEIHRQAAESARAIELDDLEDDDTPDIKKISLEEAAT
jgi:putative DNA primase/helicase